MASVTFPSNIGGNGSTVTDDTNATTGLGNGGHKTRFVPALAQVVAVAAYMVPIAQNALNAPGTSATSTSSVTIGTGSKSLTLAQTGKAFAVGQWVQITSAAAPATDFMLGAITAFNAGTGAMTVNVALAGGAGTIASWAVHPASPLSLSARFGTDGSLVLTGAGALGYGTGSGGAVTQVTSKAAPVTLNKSNGQITMNAASLAAGESVVFSLGNSLLELGDVLIVNPGASSALNYRAEGGVDLAGGALIRVTNVSASPRAEAVKVNFAVIKAVAA